jgi:hypothetical protein
MLSEVGPSPRASLDPLRLFLSLLIRSGTLGATSVPHSAPVLWGTLNLILI